jgi:hypothetical protein
MPLCPNCGGGVLNNARFCSRCGAPQSNGPGTAPTRLPGTRAHQPWDVCEIVWWRGYIKSEFIAHAIGADRGEYEVARSRQFWWRKAEPPPADHKGAQGAHEALVAKLLGAGWEPLGQATPWYAKRFRRHAAGLRVLTAEEAEAAPNEEGTHA